MSEKVKRIIIVYKYSKEWAIINDLMFFCFIVGGFHLNYTFWGSWIFDVLILMLCVLLITGRRSTTKFNEEEAIEYFKKLEKENE